MTTFIVYRGGSTPTIPEDTTYKNKPVDTKEIDANFYSVEQNKIDVEELTELFKEIKEEYQ